MHRGQEEEECWLRGRFFPTEHLKDGGVLAMVMGMMDWIKFRSTIVTGLHHHTCHSHSSLHMSFTSYETFGLQEAMVTYSVHCILQISHYLIQVLDYLGPLTRSLLLLTWIERMRRTRHCKEKEKRKNPVTSKVRENTYLHASVVQSKSQRCWKSWTCYSRPPYIWLR